MPRIARVVIPGIPYHITQRGNYKQTIFTDEGDRLRYLNLVIEYTEKQKVKVLAYCLMMNHIHFIMVPSSSDSLGIIFNQISRRYAIYFNKKFERTGHLWQDRYYSCPLDEDHLYEAIKYIENNPVKAGYVKYPEEYKWSSAQAHLKKDTLRNKILSDYSEYMEVIDDWREYLSGISNDRAITNIRRCTMNGRPCGNDAFIQELEYKTGRLLRSKPKGRPKLKNR
ncbi:MAG: transposase [Bacteroidales bacterium]|nr:MAG: transposase [Bacteroidales bacterium]